MVSVGGVVDQVPTEHVFALRDREPVVHEHLLVIEAASASDHRTTPVRNLTPNSVVTVVGAPFRFSVSDAEARSDFDLEEGPLQRFEGQLAIVATSITADEEESGSS
jgi:hypothetical protein